MNKIAKDKLFIQVTYEDLLEKLWLIALFKINCEIYVKPKLIDSCKDADLNKIKSVFDKKNISRAIHAPIHDPYENSFEIFEESYYETAKICKKLNIKTVVMHVEYSLEKSPSVEGWLKESLEIWKRIADMANRDGITVLLENHNESSAEPIVIILKEIDSENLMGCFDVGHFNAFGKKDVISLLDDYPKYSIREIHLSDNLGDGDTHLPLGKGKIDFLKFFNAVEERSINPVYTIEAKDAWGVICGMRYLRKTGKL